MRQEEPAAPTVLSRSKCPQCRLRQARCRIGPIRARGSSSHVSGRETTASGSSVAIAAVSASSEALPASNAAVPPPGPARPVFPLLDNVRSFVIDIDVVPRAFLLVDPLYELARRLPALRNLLSWRGSLLGGDMLTDTRFLYENMGQVFFIEARGSRVRVSKLTPEEANSALILSIDKFISDPVNILQALMDHNHIRYERDLSSALLAAKFRQRVHTENTINHNFHAVSTFN
eukprot:jgi/Mesvir1/6263/Mv02845-RA.1